MGVFLEKDDAGPGAKPAQHRDTRDELGKC